MFKRITDLKLLKSKTLLAIDTETTGLDILKDSIIMSSLSDGVDSWAIYTDDLLKDKITVAQMASILTDKTVIKLFHTLQYDYNMFRYDGGILINIFVDEKGNILVHDVRIMAHLVNENCNNKLKDLSVKYIDKDAKAWEIKLKSYVKENKIKIEDTGYSEIPEEILIPYACSDAHYTFKLYEKFKPILEKENLWNLYITEMELLEAVMKMEERGVLIDKKRILKSIPPLNEKLTELENRIFQLTPEKFNINSPDQIANILFDKMGYAKIKGDSTDEEVLKEYHTELTDLIIEYRNKMKLKNTYFEAILNRLDEGNVLHCSFNQIGTRTGRFSSYEPNLQNIPHEGGVREIFIPRPGTRWFCFDYKQIEMCLFAHYAKDSRMIRYIKDGKSLHKTMASDLFRIDYNKVKKESDEYFMGKQVNFGILYGMGQKSLGKKLGIPEHEASTILKRVYLMYPSIKILRRKVIDKIKATGYIFNMFGRRRRLESDDAYKGVNALIQGVTGDMLKVAMVRIHKFILDNKLETYMILTIHDELILEIPKKEEYIVDTIIELMTNFNQYNLRVPISVDVEIVEKNWGIKFPYNPEQIKREIDEGVRYE